MTSTRNYLRFTRLGTSTLSKRRTLESVSRHRRELHYMEGGEPTLPPIEMRERMYNVVRLIKIHSQMMNQDYKLKKNDVIKMGRVKHKVKAIHIIEKIKVREQKVAR